MSFLKLIQKSINLFNIICKYIIGEDSAIKTNIHITKILFIENTRNFHYEIIESIIINYNTILNIRNEDQSFIIYINLQTNIFNKNYSFINYIQTKYPNIIFAIPKQYDYYISVTIYDEDYVRIDKNSNRKFYISHHVTDRLKTLSNVFFLLPSTKNYLNANILPYNKYKINTSIPIYIVQGDLLYRRNINLLEKILSINYSYDFKIKIVGRETLPDKFNKYKDKIIIRNNLNFIDFHKEFLDAYVIMPLITKNCNPRYYNNTSIASSINYASGYNLKCLIDKDLQEIYNLDNVEIFQDENDIVDAFKKTLITFYNKK